MSGTNVSVREGLAAGRGWFTAFLFVGKRNVHSGMMGSFTQRRKWSFPSRFLPLQARLIIRDSIVFAG
jgi:hypothetical protein